MATKRTITPYTLPGSHVLPEAKPITIKGTWETEEQKVARTFRELRPGKVVTITTGDRILKARVTSNRPIRRKR